MACDCDTKTNQEKIEELGWLNENGICCFPREVVGVCLGYKINGIPAEKWSRISEENRQRAVKEGWVKFIDGDGREYSFDGYCKEYPDFPDPIFMLEMQDRWPPGTRKTAVIGKR